MPTFAILRTSQFLSRRWLGEVESDVDRHVNETVSAGDSVFRPLMLSVSTYIYM